MDACVDFPEMYSFDLNTAFTVGSEKSDEIHYTLIKPLYILPLSLEISRYIYCLVHVSPCPRIAVTDTHAFPKLHAWSRDGNRWISVGNGWIKEKATPTMIAELIAWRMTRNREERLSCSPQ